MIDTIKVRFTGKVDTQIPPHRRISLENGIRFNHDGLGNCKAEVELPKLLYGHNGRLIENRAELDDGGGRFRSILSRYVKFESWEFVLIDLVWQFQTRPADVILAYQWFRFPGVRSWPTMHKGDRQISWSGARLGLKLYRKAEGVLRVELRLAGKELRKRIDADAPLNFAELYRVFRAEVVKLSPIQLPETRKHSMAEIIVTIPTEFQNDVILTYQQGRTDRAVRGLKEDMSAARISKCGWNLRDLLPSEKPPPPVHCEPKCNQKPSKRNYLKSHDHTQTNSRQQSKCSHVHRPA